MEDKQIIELFCNRSETALQKTEEKYGKFCLKIADNILHDREDSEECVNDTWMKAWLNIPPTIPECLQIFLGKITRNLAFDKYRVNRSAKRGGGEMSLVLEELEEVVACRDSVEGQMERKLLIEAINTYLHKLPERECNVFIRRYFFAETTAQISKRYDLKESNVLMILSRTRKKLQTYLVQEGLV